MNLARYGLRCMKLILQHKPLAIAWSCCDYSKVVIAMRILRCYPAPFSFNHQIPLFMNRNNYRGGRHKKADPSTAFRCSVNFTASEQSQLLAMQQQSGIESLSAFIKMQVFGKTFKVHYIDDNSRIFIDRLSNMNNHYREIRISYNLLLTTLRENFNERKAMAALYKIENLTIELVKLNREIVALARQFDEQWSQKSL